jgi:hypothetical protein
MRWAVCFATHSHHNKMPHYRPKAMEQTNHGLKLSKLWAKPSVFISLSFQLFIIVMES